MAHDVVLSYTPECKPLAEALCNGLEGKRVRCWIAPRDVPATTSAGRALFDALGKCRLLVLVHGGDDGRDPSWRAEVERAVRLGLPVVPVCVGAMPAAARAAVREASHWLDVMVPEVEDVLTDRVEAVSLLMAGSPGTPAPAMLDISPFLRSADSAAGGVPCLMSPLPRRSVIPLPPVPPTHTQYTRPITRAQPALVLFLVDHSSSMIDPFATEARSKGDVIALMINRFPG